jgi:hypothetical protein
MSIAFGTPEDRSASIAASIKPKSPWRVRSVDVLPDYRLRVRFMDGVEGFVDMKELVFSPEAGVFQALRDRAVFAQAEVVMGAVTWPGELDLAPDAMYDAIKLSGTWELR